MTIILAPIVNHGNLGKIIKMTLTATERVKSLKISKTMMRKMN